MVGSTKSIRNGRFDEFGTEFFQSYSKFSTSSNTGKYCKKLAISKARVERAFSKHKRVHTNLRASLKAEKLADQFFIRYNFENILKISKKLVQVEDDIIDLGYDFEPFENDFD